MVKPIKPAKTEGLVAVLNFLHKSATTVDIFYNSFKLSFNFLSTMLFYRHIPNITGNK